ncbi:unnamed protein product, partial [Musa acuminata subsp. burmannicoides]
MPSATSPSALPLPIASVPTPTIYPTSRDFDDDDDRSNHGGSVLEPPQPTKPGDPVSRLTYLNAISDPKVSFDPTYRVPVPVTGVCRHRHRQSIYCSTNSLSHSSSRQMPVTSTTQRSGP